MHRTWRSEHSSHCVGVCVCVPACACTCKAECACHMDRPLGAPAPHPFPPMCVCLGCFANASCAVNHNSQWHAWKGGISGRPWQLFRKKQAATVQRTSSAQRKSCHGECSGHKEAVLSGPLFVCQSCRIVCPSLSQSPWAHPIAASRVMPL